MLTPLRGLVVPRIFKRGVSFSGGGRWLSHATVRHLFWWVHLVCYQPRRWKGFQQYRPRAIRKLRAHAQIRLYSPPGCEQGPGFVACFGLIDDVYLGTPESLNRMLHWGVRYFFARAGGRVASVGYDPGRKKWHGWSHRARGIFDSFEDAAAFAESVS